MVKDSSYRVPFTGAATNVGYDRSLLQAGIVHVGPSHFARSHWFKMIHDYIKSTGDLRWGIRAISPKNWGVKQALAGQDYLYPLVERSQEGNKTDIIGSLMDITVASENPATAVDVLADPNVRLITMTITEAGYYYNKDTNNLNFDHPDIKECLSHMDEPSTTVGLLVAALEKRMQSGAPPLTIMSCDNVDNNGTVIRNTVLAYADLKSTELGQYIRKHIKFPTTMVDRITPSTPEEFQQAANDNVFAWPVHTTPMPKYQMVVENNFAGEMPDLEKVGATIVEDVSPYKLMKIRLLNGAHMAMGCIGRVAGYDNLIGALQQEPHIQEFLKGFLKETALTLAPSNFINYSSYANDVVDRLNNPKITDPLWRLVRDGTKAKLDKRLLGSLTDAITSKSGHEYLAFATAAWIRHLTGTDDHGKQFDIKDSYAIELGLPEMALNSINGNYAPEGVIGAVRDKFPNPELIDDPTFKESVYRHFRNIHQHGIIDALAMTNDPQVAPKPSKHQAALG